MNVIRLLVITLKKFRKCLEKANTWKEDSFSWQLPNVIPECLWQYIKIISLDEKFNRSCLTERRQKNAFDFH